MGSGARQPDLRNFLEERAVLHEGSIGKDCEVFRGNFLGDCNRNCGIPRGNCQLIVGSLVAKTTQFREGTSN